MTPLRPDAVCCRQAHWRTDLPPDTDPGPLEAALAERGWRSCCRHPTLKVLRHDQGHEMAWVVTTGRVQIRIDLAVPEQKRRRKARALYRDLSLGLRALYPPPEEGG